MSGGDDRWARMWDVDLQCEIAAIPLAGAATCLVVHPTQSLVVVGDAGGNVLVAELVRA